VLPRLIQLPHSGGSSPFVGIRIGMALGPYARSPMGNSSIRGCKRVILLPTGDLTGQKSSPSSEAGDEMFAGSPSPIPVGDPEFHVHAYQEEATI
jgi:hypothetical protein